jgi:peptide deformylase
MLRLTNSRRLFTPAQMFQMATHVKETYARVALAKVPEVNFEPASCPMTATVLDYNGKPASVGDVVDKLHATLRAAREVHHSDRGILSAPMLGYNTRIVVIHSGLERRAMINPKVTLTSPQVVHQWAMDQPSKTMCRVARYRSVAVKYTTVEGDDETWYALPLEESEALQGQLDLMDGIPVTDRVAPCVAREPDLYPEAIRSGCVSVVDASVFDKHEADLMRLVEKIPRCKLTVAPAA